MSIRRDVSEILGYTISVDEKGTRWDDAFASLEKEGRITKKHLIKITILLLKREEVRENEEG